MKIRITLKDPDGVHISLQDAVNASLPTDLDEDELELLYESRYDELYEEVAQWIEYGEYLTIEVDTETGTATVVPTGE